MLICSELQATKENPVKPVWWCWDTTGVQYQYCSCSIKRSHLSNNRSECNKTKSAVEKKKKGCLLLNLLEQRCVAFAQCVLLRVSSPFLLLFWRRKDPTLAISQRARPSAPTWEKLAPAGQLCVSENPRVRGTKADCAAAARRTATW